MTVTLSPRLGITRWSAGTDPFTRAQAEADHAALDTLTAIHKAGTLAARPAAAAANAGTYYLTTDTADLYLSDGVAWRPIRLNGDVALRFAWTYTLPGDIKVPSGSTDYLPHAPLAVPAGGQTLTLVGYRWTLRWGTSFTFAVKHYAAGNVNTDLVTGVVAATGGGPAFARGSGTFGTPKACADNDTWYPEVTAVSGTPSGGSVAVVGDITF